jgi:hypothetical protein
VQTTPFIVWKRTRCFEVCDQVINDFVDQVRGVELVMPFHSFLKDWSRVDQNTVRITFSD